MASTKSVVHLGYALELPPNELFSLKRQFLPLGKVGGHPSWLNSANLPSTEELSCGVCSKPLAFLLQVYCTSPQSPSHAFHRTIFVFVCRDAECSRTNDSANFVVVRGQLPRQNGYYSAERALIARDVGDVPDPYYNEATFARLCRLCGCRATKKCAKCAQQWYCSKEHQVIDWTAGGHKLQCGSIEPNSLSNNRGREETASSANPFIFKEFGIEIDVEEGEEEEGDDEQMEHSGCQPDDDDEDSDDDDNEAAESSNRALAERLKELKKFENADISEKDLEGIEEGAKDVLYKAFHRRVSANPTQILRYEKGGVPLLATDHSPRPLTAADLTASGGDGAVERRPIQNCALCGAPRQFEFQLMPHLLSLMEVDQLGKSIDWATLMIFTCSRDCAVPNDGYAREFVLKQDFVDVNEEMPPQDK